MSNPENGFYNEIVALVPGSPTVKAVVGRTDGKSTTGFEVVTVGSPADLKTAVKSSWRQVGTVRGNVVCMVNEPYPTLSLFKTRDCP
jgi:hypothetical protein